MRMAAYLPILVLCAGLAAFIARSKERRTFAWFFLGLLTGPIAVVIILLLGDR